MNVCRDISPTSKMHLEIQMRSVHLPWAKNEPTGKTIDIQELFDDYWTSKAHELSVRGQSKSPTRLLIADREAKRKLSLGSIVAI